MPPAAWWRRPFVVDVLVTLTAAGLLLFGSVRAAAGQSPPRRPLDLLAYAILVAVAVALGLRRRWPVAVLTCCVLATVLYLAYRYPYGPILLAAGFAMANVAVTEPPRRSMLAGGIATLAVVGAEAVTALHPTRDLVTDLQLLAWTSWLLLPWALGTVIRDRWDAVIQAREAERRRRLYEERLQMAREVHDIVGHGLAVISMHAGVALHVLDKRPEQARVALTTIRDASRQSLEDLRSTLRALRTDHHGEDRRVVAQLDQLDSLIATTEGSGVTICTEIVGTSRRLPTFTDITAYRIVQESLTNVLRHAHATAATVRLSYLPDAVTVDVTDNGRAVVGQAEPRDGHGLAGMAERAAAVGGILEAGPRHEGGWRVRAWLPLGERTE